MTEDSDHIRKGKGLTSGGVGSNKFDAVTQKIYSDIIEVSPDAIFLTDAGSGLIVEANEQASGLIGRPRKEIIGMHQSDLHPKEEAAHYRAIFRQHRQKGAAIEGDLFVLHSDGHHVPVEITASTIEIGGRKFMHGIFRDITERKQTETQLVEDGRRFRELFENVADYALLLEPRESAPPVIVDANTAAFEKHGYTRDEMIGQPITLLDTASSAEKIGERLSLIQKGGTVCFEVEHVCKDGSTFFAEAACRKLESGSKGLFYSVERDITERKQVEEAVSHTKRELEKFFSVVPSLICIAGTDGYFKEINQEWEKTLGYSKDELLSKPFTDFIHPDDLEMTSKEVEKQLSGQSTKAFVNRYRCKDGGYRWLEWQATPASENNLYAAANDITERVQAAEQLQEQLSAAEKSRQSILYMLEDLNASTAAIKQAKEAWEQTFDAVTDPIFLHDGGFRIVRANRAYAEQGGMEIGDVIGKPYWEVFPKGDGPLPGCLKALEKAEEEEEEEEEISTEDGSIYISRSYVIPTEEGSHHTSIHVMHDITERRQAEINLAHVNRALTTLSMVNHELVHAENEADLMQAICRAIVEQHGYRMAWVGYAQDNKNRSIKIMASAGAEHRLLDKMQPGWAENESGMGPSGRAVRSGKMQLTQDIAADPEYPPWQDELLKHGCAAGIALPMLDADNRVFGLLHVYAERVNAFTDKEISLLQEMAEDLAFGVRSLRLRLHRDEILELNQQQLVQIHRNLQETIAAVARAVEARDPYTAGHQRRVAELATAIARAMKLGENQIEGIRMGATIHDIGKIHLPAEILSKPSKLSDIEFSLIRGHPQAGFEILKDIRFPWPVADIACQHHERLDGSGYPQGLKGDEICLEARIVAVADVVEAMSSHRPYRAELGIDAALDEIRKHRGSRYDEQAVDACLELFSNKAFSFASEA